MDWHLALAVVFWSGLVLVAYAYVGYPVLLSQSLKRRPFVVLTIGTLFDVSRQRDGRR